MTEIYEGVTRHPVTAIKLIPLKVTQTKTVEKDSYAALQVALGDSRLRREVESVQDIASLAVGQLCTIVATSKGKGYAGGVKRWGFAGGPRTHGQSDRLRAPGSIGQGTTPGRVYRGKHMAGRMGGDTVSIKNVKIVKIDPDQQIIWVTGPVPGGRQSLVRLDLYQG